MRRPQAPTPGPAPRAGGRTNQDPPPLTTTAVQILIVEDQPDDAELMVEALEDGGFDVTWQVVSTEAGYRDALNSSIDVILCDHALPSFDAGRAFQLLQQARLPIPLVIVSGLITEELAIEFMQLGAYGFVGKDRLGRLGAAVHNALERRALEREVHTGASAEADPMHEPAIRLQDSTETADVAGRVWFDALPDAYLVMLPDTTIVAVSDGYVVALRRSRQELVGRKALDVFPRSRPDAFKPHSLAASIARTLVDAVPDAMPIQKYEVVRAKHQGGGLVERYWSVVHSALVGQDGNVAWVMQRIEDVTELVDMRASGSATPASR
jgi:DNA-binding NarL/FixJ family response regulator